HRAPATPPTTRRSGRKIARNLAVDRHPRRLRVRGKADESDARTRAELMGSPWHRTIVDQPGLLACTGCEAAFNPILTKQEQTRQGVRPCYRRSPVVVLTRRRQQPPSPNGLPTTASTSRRRTTTSRSWRRDCGRWHLHLQFLA